MNPLISIITPVYNAEKYINQYIESVLAQTYSNWELILIDDCSGDHSIELIERYLIDPRIKLFRNKQNKGPALTRNIGLDNASGDYIAFLDSDDFWERNRLKNQIDFMKNNNLSISHGNYHFCNLDGEILKTVYVKSKIDYQCLLKGNQFKTMTMMLKRELIGKHRFENIRHEDYAFFLDCLKRASYSLAEESSTDSYCRIGNKLSVSANKFKSAVWTWDIYRRHQKLSIIKSLYYFTNYVISGIIKYKR